MENHKNLSLSDLRVMIIRYGAKYMEAFESDLYFDCKVVGEMQPGESVFWMVSATHTFMYTAKKMHEQLMDVGMVSGNRFNYRIDCVDGRFGDARYAMMRVYEKDIRRAVDEYKED